MKLDKVPQDNSKTYAGAKKLLYAKSDTEGYVQVKSSGWEIEEMATQDAVDFYEHLATEAAAEVISGKYSPLFYHMYKQRMDLPLLAQTSGFFQWTIKRHFKPRIYAQLSDEKLSRYANVLDLSVEQLKSLPETL